MRTLLVERHNVPVGARPPSARGRFEFEVALHQLSGIGSPDQAFMLRRLFEGLGIADKLEFVEEHDLYRVVVPGRLDVTIPADWQGAVGRARGSVPRQPLADSRTSSRWSSS